MLSLYISIIFIFHVTSADPAVTTNPWEYLQRFGHLRPSPRGNHGNQAEQAAIRSFQAIAGLRVTGRMDEVTLAMMARKRCGNKDVDEDENNDKRKKRHSLHDPWKTRSLTYKITRYTNNMSPSKVDDIIRRAFKFWSDVTSLTFSVTSQVPDIEILFTTKDHGDDKDFDGPGGTLAHAFYPKYGGDVHFDDDEHFSNSTDIYLLEVATHEIGHSLGLKHSDVRGALLSPFYRGYDPNLKLHPDDISGIQALYGKPDGTESTITVGSTAPVEPPATTARPTAPTAGPLYCNLPKIDATVYMPKWNKTYVFSGSDYYRVNSDLRVDPGYPKSITEVWEGLRRNLDAALCSREPSEDNIFYFFKRRKYWKFDGSLKMPGYPKNIGVHGFKGLPGNLDSAFVNGRDGRVFFTKGDRIYRLANTTGTAYEQRPVDLVTSNYWRGAPPGVDAALQWMNNRTYLFYGDEYVRLSEHFDVVDFGYPRHTATSWFDCPVS